MRSETVTTVLPVSRERVFEYMSDIRNLPEWATEFARELREEDGEYRVVNNPASSCSRSGPTSEPA
jgi:uncharacterized protein YndB with AHSA1/START domain